MKNSFTVQYATHLLVVAIGATGPWAFIVAQVTSLVLGALLDRGIIVADIAVDKLKEALKEEQWKAAAAKAYAKATAGNLTEDQKSEIRKQYLAALAAYATYGNGLRDN